MTSVLPVFAGQMPIEMRIPRAWIGLAIQLLALLGIGGIETAIDDDPVRTWRCRASVAGSIGSYT